jgi:hypothetical protein
MLNWSLGRVERATFYVKPFVFFLLLMPKREAGFKFKAKQINNTSSFYLFIQQQYNRDG